MKKRQMSREETLEKIFQDIMQEKDSDKGEKKIMAEKVVSTKVFNKLAAICESMTSVCFAELMYKTGFSYSDIAAEIPNLIKHHKLRTTDIEGEFICTCKVDKINAKEKSPEQMKEYEKYACELLETLDESDKKFILEYLHKLPIRLDETLRRKISKDYGPHIMSSTRQLGIIIDREVKGKGLCLTSPLNLETQLILAKKLKEEAQENALLLCETNLKLEETSFDEIMQRRIMREEAIMAALGKDKPPRDNIASTYTANVCNDKQTASANNNAEMEAMALFILEQKASVSLLQNRLNIGYLKAKSIMSVLEARGHIKNINGTTNWQILISKEEFNNFYGGE